jgi:hypothetical protein
MSTKAPNIFISWSGPRSKHVATALNLWLPAVLQSVRPWFSRFIIEKGARSLEEIAKALDSIEVGICCLTPENLNAPWILYEGGALSKRIGQKARLCTYLLGGLRPEDVPPPLGSFQATRADNAEETWQMLQSINAAVNPDPVPEISLKKLFQRMWPDLEKEISNMPPVEEKVAPHRSAEDMFAEVLSILRSDTASPRGWGLHLPWHRYVHTLYREFDEGLRPPCINCGVKNIAMIESGDLVCVSCDMKYPVPEGMPWKTKERWLAKDAKRKPKSRTRNK